jgi:hypothetical protein
MITQFAEVTDGLSYGKFLVCRLDTNDLATKSVMPDAHGARDSMTTPHSSWICNAALRSRSH